MNLARVIAEREGDTARARIAIDSAARGGEALPLVRESGARHRAVAARLEVERRL